MCEETLKDGKVIVIEEQLGTKAMGMEQEHGEGKIQKQYCLTQCRDGGRHIYIHYSEVSTLM